MMASDGREIVFAGAGVLWGATTFVRGLHVTKAHKKLSDHSGLIVGLVLTVACTGYLAMSLLDLRR